MKQMTPKKVTINDVDFYITPFGAFYASNLSGELATLLVPLLSGVASLGGSGQVDLNTIKVEEAAPVLANAVSGLDGNKVESIMRKLLIDKGNVSYSYTEDGETVQDKLTYDSANELFCQDILDMYKLAWEVIQLNFGSFFGKASSLFGSQQGTITIKKRK